MRSLPDSSPAPRGRISAASTNVLARAESLMLKVEARDAASHAKRHNNVQQTLSALEREMGRQVGNVSAKFGVPRLHAALTTRTASPAPPRFSFAAQPLPPRKSVLVPRSARIDADIRRIRRKSQAKRLEAMKLRLAQEGRVREESGSAAAKCSAAGARAGRRPPAGRASRLVPRKPQPTIKRRIYRRNSYDMRVQRVKASVTAPAAARTGSESAPAADTPLSTATEVGGIVRRASVLSAQRLGTLQEETLCADSGRRGSGSARRASVLSARGLETAPAMRASPAALPAPATLDVDARSAAEAQEEQWDEFVDEDSGHAYAVSRLTGASYWLEGDAEYATDACGDGTYGDATYSGELYGGAQYGGGDAQASSDIAAAAASLASPPPLPSRPSASSAAGRRGSTLISGLLCIDEELTPAVRRSVTAAGRFCL